MRRKAIMYANMDREDSKWFVLGAMDLPSAKGQVTKIAKRGGAGMYPLVGYRSKDRVGITWLSCRCDGKWREGRNAAVFKEGVK